MKRVHFKTNVDEASIDRAHLVETVLVLLNRVSVELAIESQAKGTITKDQFRVAVRLIGSACLLGTLLPDLIKEKSIRLPYAFPIARMMYERLLNASYVLSDAGAAERAVQYSVFRAFKDQKSFFSVGIHSELISKRYKLSRKSPLVKKALEYFESAKSKEEFEHSRTERCKKVEEKCRGSGRLFEAAEQAGHALSSEIVHGSYLSTVLFSEAPSPDTPEIGFDEATTMILTLVVLSAEGLGRLLVKLFPLHPSPPLLVQAGKTFMHMELPDASELINSAYSAETK